LNANVEQRTFGDRVVGDCLAHAKNVEDHRPTLRPYDAWGGRVDEIQTHPSWTALHDIAAAEGLIAIPYEMRHGAASRVHQMSKLYLFNASSGLYSCPLAMTDGAAKFLQVYQRQHQQRASSSSSSPPPLPHLTQAYDHLTSRIPREFWTSGQWMTEKNGGSDVAAGCTTIARRQPDGTYRLYGFKWFTSATDSDMAITLARIVDDADGTVGAGSAGLSCFFLHVRDPRTRALNRIAIARLKDKLGTKQLPTAELELQGSEATLVSAPGRGVAAISTMVNITRLWNAVSSVANARRMLALCRDYAHRRTVFGSALASNPLHLETLANMEVANRASLLFVLDAAAMLGRIEHAEAAQAVASAPLSSSPPSAATSASTSTAGTALTVAEENALLRLMTPALKLYTAKEAVRVVTEGVESFGGAGYVEDTRLPVILRDTHGAMRFTDYADVLFLTIIPSTVPRLLKLALTVTSLSPSSPLEQCCPFGRAPPTFLRMMCCACCTAPRVAPCSRSPSPLRRASPLACRRPPRLSGCTRRCRARLPTAPPRFARR
jgi:alkylation response protein AidB-like acyl-CoA dehydrogenase